MVILAESLVIHPVADLFPMLGEEELVELAEDIKQRGLLHPIVLDADGRVLDGRNRLAACKIAEVDPVFKNYTDDDPDGYALAVNVTRRHMNKGQKAMVSVSARLLKNNNLTQADLAEEVGDLSQSYIAQANGVHKYAPELVPLVISGAMPLADAYAETRIRKRRVAETKAKCERLESEAPDLSARLADGNDELTLDEAIILLDGRLSEERRKEVEARAEERRQSQVETHLLCETVVAIAQMEGTCPGAIYDSAYALPGRAVTKEVIGKAIRALGELMDVWEERRLT